MLMMVTFKKLKNASFPKRYSQKEKENMER